MMMIHNVGFRLCASLDMPTLIEIVPVSYMKTKDIILETFLLS